MQVLTWLRDAGVTVETGSVQPSRRGAARPDTILVVVVADATAQFAVEEKGRAPYPNELPRLSERRQALSHLGHPLLVVPFVPEALAAVVNEAGWSWADAQGNFDLRAPGIVLRQRRVTKAPRAKRRTLPQGSGSLAIIRALIRSGQGEDKHGGASALAAPANVSQPRASQVLAQLHDLKLVEKSPSGLWKPNREALLDRFLDEYVGPRGSERFLYSLDSPTDVAVLAAQVSQPKRLVVVSADVGPDLIQAWRRPSVVILYAKQELVPSDLGLVEAQGRHDANVIVRNPADQSIFPASELVAEFGGVKIPLADPSQMMWDLQELGGADRLEAAGMLREWLLALH